MVVLNSKIIILFIVTIEIMERRLMAGNANSGRKRNTTRQINQYLEANKSKIPQLLTELTSQALKTQHKDVICPKCKHEFTVEIHGGGNIEAIKWLLERHYGKAPQSLDIKSKNVILTGEELAAMLPMLLEHEQLLLSEPISEPSSSGES